MANATRDQIIALHNAGVALPRAWLTYAHPDLKAKWQGLQEQSVIDVLNTDAKAAAAIEGDLVAKLSQSFARSQALLRERGDLEQRLKSNILGYIAKGNLIGFGYELPRSLTSVPVRIPKEAWGGTCDWHKAMLRFRGLEFVDVRLVTKRIRNEILERGVVDTTPTSPAGRPGVASAIEAAFHALNESGKIDPNASQSSHYPALRGWLEQYYPDLPVPPATLSEKTIYKYFSPLFKGL